MTEKAEAGKPRGAVSAVCFSSRTVAFFFFFSAATFCFSVGSFLALTTFFALGFFAFAFFAPGFFFSAAALPGFLAAVPGFLAADLFLGAFVDFALGALLGALGCAGSVA